MRLFFLPLAAALSLGACAPRALYFHESTKVAFAADYNTSDTQPVATSFGYKRRIVAVVPAQERNIPIGGRERDGTNSGEALSLVSKFNVRAGTDEGIAITNNFASGMAARIMTRNVGSDAVSALMHNTPIEVSAATGKTAAGVPAATAVDDRLARIMLKRGRPSSVHGKVIEYEKNPLTGKLQRQSAGTPPSNGEAQPTPNGKPKTDMPIDAIEYEKDPVTGKLRPKIWPPKAADARPGQ